MEQSKTTQWFKKRKWDIVFYGIFALIVFVPAVRMPVVSIFQRIFAFSPKEISKEKQKSVQNFDWFLMNTKGATVNLSQSENKVILINLWATWCPPCVAEMPALQKLYNQYGNKMDFYFISNESPDVIQQFMDNKGYTFPVYISASNYPADFDSDRLPTTYIINKNGKIIMNETGAHDWFSNSFQKKVEELVQE